LPSDIWWSLILYFRPKPNSGKLLPAGWKPALIEADSFAFDFGRWCRLSGHADQALKVYPARVKLMIILNDGLPNDHDYGLKLEPGFAWRPLISFYQVSLWANLFSLQDPDMRHRNLKVWVDGLMRILH